MKSLHWAVVTVVFIGAVSCSSDKLFEKAKNVEVSNQAFVQSALQVSYKTGEIQATFETEKKIYLEKLNAIEVVDEKNVTFSSVIKAFEDASTLFSNKVSPLTFMKYVSTDEQIRGEAEGVELASQQLNVDIFQREKLFAQIQKVSAANLSNVDARLLTSYLDSFKRNGLELSATQRAHFSELKKELIDAETKYSTNLVESVDIVELSDAELDGVSPSVYGKFPADAVTHKRSISLSQPVYMRIMENAKSSVTRAKAEFVWGQKGGVENKNLLERAIAIRSELAGLLGFETHADYVLSNRMAKTKTRVNSFLSDLRTKLLPLGQKDVARLLKSKVEQMGELEVNQVESYDWRYYENRVRNSDYDINNEVIAEYFPAEHVVDSMMSVYQTLLGVTFERATDIAVWHPEVRAFRVLDSGKTVAVFFMDLYPRDGKYEHAAAFPLISGYRHDDGRYNAPIAAIVANMTAAVDNKPALLQHSDVETLFHEFGHIMHQVLTRARYASMSGTSVQTDFVEAPSQMLENWVWDTEILKKISSHYLSRETLPNALIQKMLAAKKFNGGMRYLRQLTFAMLDMEYHTNAVVDSTQVYARHMKDTMLVGIQPGTMPQANFGHLMGGYDAGYYGYLYSEVFAQDMFTRFQIGGLLNKEVGMQYRKNILEMGSELEPLDLLRSFLGREPNAEAFMQGLLGD